MGGATRLGTTAMRLMGPPAWLSVTSPVCSCRVANNCLNGSGFFGASGSVPTSRASMVAVMSIKNYAAPGACGREVRVTFGHSTGQSASVPLKVSELHLRLERTP